MHVNNLGRATSLQADEMHGTQADIEDFIRSGLICLSAHRASRRRNDSPDKYSRTVSEVPE